MDISDPIAHFADWYAAAEDAEPRDANAFCLATASATGVPSARILLLKGFPPEERGFVFYTNLESPKALELDANPVAAMCFYWKSLGRQMRIEGAIAPVADATADAYYATRPRGSQLGAWASHQSRPLDDRATLEARVAEMDARFADAAPPRPPNWSGFCLEPARFEFWQEGEFRLHDRFAVTRAGDGWACQRLFP